MSTKCSHRFYRGVLVAAIILCVSSVARAEGDPKAKASVPAPAYKNLRIEEDWSKAPEGGFFDPAKHIRLGGGEWLSVGGSARYRYESWRNFGFAENNDDDLSLCRLFLHTDWHFGPHWRIFLEGRFSDITQRDLPGSRREAIDFDRGDLWNTFIEAKYPIGNTTLTARVGRFELEFGKQRLVSPLDWSNNRRLFEGAQVRLAGTKSPWQVDAFATRPIVVDGSSFTLDESTKHTWFSGVYYTQKLGAEKKFFVDAYLLALNADNRNAVPQDTYTAGARAGGPMGLKNLTWEAEAAYQFGHRDHVAGSPTNKDNVSAWMLTAEATYTFNQSNLAPWITLGADYASGDADRSDDKHGTFNQLFPLGHAFLGYIDVVGRQNIIDARLTAGIWPIPKKLKVWSDLHYFWRANDDDALYNASGAVQRPSLYTTKGGRTIVSGAKEVGIELDLTASYQFTRYTTALLGYAHFWDGGFIATTNPHRDIDFVYAGFEFKF